MSEPLLNALMKLFALIIDINEDSKISIKKKKIIRSFLSYQLNSELVEKYLRIFDEYISIFNQDSILGDSVQAKKKTSLAAIRILGICEKINTELEQKQKIFLIIQLIEFVSYKKKVSDREFDFLLTVATAFNISKTEYQNILSLIIHPIEEIPSKPNVLVINCNKQNSYQEIKHVYIERFDGELIFLNILSTNTFIFRYLGVDDVQLNGQSIIPGRTYFFDYGSTIRSSRIKPIYYSDVIRKFSEATFKDKISISADKVEFRFKNSENGVQELNLQEESGKLVGIIGGSGVGKSTLLNVLNGNLKPKKGKVLINGYDLNNDKEKNKLQGVIGYMPQEDLLIEDLTVYQNLFFNAKLCLNQFGKDEIKKTINKTLADLDLQDIKDLKVGNPLNKVISGGQRKRLNIGLELIREPSILFVDEPTSGLSSIDSEMVLNLLKEQTYKGKLVIINIHQPSSDLYKMFDKIIILDRGGYQIYNGNPAEALVYFKSISKYANAAEDQCTKCGNSKPEEILQIVEAKIVNEYGKLTPFRKVSPKEWFVLFQKHLEQKNPKEFIKEKIPENYYSIPGLIKQSGLFFVRDLLSKLANRQYILISLLEAPLLALILGYFTKYIHGTSENPDAYLFIENENLPAYLFISVIVALFLGLIISSDEIIKDRKILKRESFLNLSRFSYLNSKILMLFILSAIQTISYVLIANAILDIKGMTLSYWLILFSTSCFANMLGLNISSGFNSIIIIYVLIPFLLIPQILFSGVIVKFDKLHKNLTSQEYVPIIGDMMTSRWAYEALAVEQFKDNKFQKNFFELDKIKSNSNYTSNLLIKKLKQKFTELEINIRKNINPEQSAKNIQLLKEQFHLLKTSYPKVPLGDIHTINLLSINGEVVSEYKGYLKGLEAYLHEIINIADREIAKKEIELSTQLGGKEAFVKFKDEYENTNLNNMVLNRKQAEQIIEKNNSFIRKFEPIYMEPTSKYGRAQFYASEKIIGKTAYHTFWFNLTIIWITSLLLYFTLYFDLLRKVVSYFENIRSK